MAIPTARGPQPSSATSQVVLPFNEVATNNNDEKWSTVASAVRNSFHFPITPPSTPVEKIEIGGTGNPFDGLPDEEEIVSGTGNPFDGLPDEEEIVSGTNNSSEDLHPSSKVATSNNEMRSTAFAINTVSNSAKVPMTPPGNLFEKKEIGDTGNPFDGLPDDTVGSAGRLLLRALSDYCNDNAFIKASHKQKFAKDLTEHQLLGDTFQILKIKKQGKRSGTHFSVEFKTGKEPTTHAQLNEILEIFTQNHHEKKSSLIQRLTALKNYSTAQAAKTVVKQKKLSYEEALTKAIEDAPKGSKGALSNRLHSQKYINTKQQHEEAAALFFSKKDPTGADLATFLEAARPFLQHNAGTEKIYSELSKKSGKLTEQELKTLDYTWGQTVLSWIGRADVEKTTARFLTREEKIGKQSATVLKSFLTDNMPSAQNVAKKGIDKVERAREKAQKSFDKHYKGGEVSPFKLGDEQRQKTEQMENAIQTESYQILCNMVLEAATGLERTFTDKLSQAIGDFNLEKAEKHSRNTHAVKQDESSILSTWFDTFDQALINYDDLQSEIYEIAKEELKENPQRSAILTELAAAQTSQRTKILDAIDKSLGEAINTFIKVDFGAQIDRAAQTTWKAKVSSFLKDQSIDVIQGKKVLNQLEQYNNRIIAITKQVESVCRKRGMTEDQIVKRVNGFKELIITKTDMLNKTHQAIPPLRSTWQYLKSSFGALPSSLGMSIGTIATSSVALIGGTMLLLGTTGGIGLMVLGGVGLIGLIATTLLTKYNNASNDRQNMKNIYKEFKALASSIDPQWKIPPELAPEKSLRGKSATKNPGSEVPSVSV